MPKGLKSLHVLAEFAGGEPSVLDDPQALEALLVRSAKATGATVVGSQFHRLPDGGVTGMVLLSESHLAIHTSPERGYAAADYFTCGDCDPRLAHPHLEAGLGASHSSMLVVDRGLAGRTRPYVRGYRGYERVRLDCRSPRLHTRRARGAVSG